MTLVRQRRQQQALRLILPPPPALSHSAFSPSPASSSTTSSSSTPPPRPGIIDTLSDLSKLSILGRGNGGTVYKVLHEQTGAVYALKVLRSNEEAAAHEAEILQRVDSSEHVVRCLGVMDGGFTEVDGGGGGDLCIMMEYMDGGSLRDVLCRNNRLPEKVVAWIARRVLMGLKHLHQMRVVHGDIKPSNLLLSSNGDVKIADFGASSFSTTTTAGSGTGTCAYMSPERMDPERCAGEESNGFEGDVWAFGVVVMECYAGRFPLVGPGQRPDWVTLMCPISFEEDVGSVLRAASPEFQGFCRRCLERDWRRRGTVEELLAHPFVTRHDQVSGMEELDAYIASIN